MKFRTTLILGLLCVGLVVYLYLVEFQRAAQEGKKETLVEFSQDDATAVALSYPNRAIKLAKTDKGWRITEPVEAPADKTTVQNLIRAVAECEVKRTLEETPHDLAPFGLDKPEATVEVTLGNRKLPAIRIGKTTPVGFSTYVQRADDGKVRLVGSVFRSGMNKQVKDLRDKKIVALDIDKVAGIHLVTADRDIVLTKYENAWRIEKPAAYAADDSTVRSFLSSLRSMRATDFPTDKADDLGLYGLDEPRLTVSVTAENDANRKEVSLGAENDKKEIFVKSAANSTIYTVSNWVYRDLDKATNDFRDKTVLAFEKDAVRRVEITGKDGEPVVLARNGDVWSLEGAKEKPDSMKIDQLLTDLRELKGYEIASDAPDREAEFGLDPPQLTIALRAGDKEIGAVRLGSYSESETEKKFTAQRAGRPTVLYLREYMFNRVNRTREDFLPKPTPTPGKSAQ